MRNLSIAILITLATQVGAADKKYSDKACKDISDAVDFLLALTPEMWKDLKKTLKDKEKGLEISWAVDLAANYTTIYQAFCASRD